MCASVGFSRISEMRHVIYLHTCSRQEIVGLSVHIYTYIYIYIYTYIHTHIGLDIDVSTAFHHNFCALYTRIQVLFGIEVVKPSHVMYLHTYSQQATVPYAFWHFGALYTRICVRSKNMPYHIYSHLLTKGDNFISLLAPSTHIFAQVVKKSHVTYTHTCSQQVTVELAPPSMSIFAPSTNAFSHAIMRGVRPSLVRASMFTYIYTYTHVYTHTHTHYHERCATVFGSCFYVHLYIYIHTCIHAHTYTLS